MTSLITIAQSLGLAYSSGISLYATVALLGFASHAGWIGPLPGALGGLTNPFVIGVATILAVIEFLATLVPGIASLWEAAHTFIASPEPVTNAAVNTAELSVLASLSYLIWHHPLIRLELRPVRSLGWSNVDLTRTRDLLLLVEQHLFPLREPSRHPSDSEKNGEEIGRERHRPIDQPGVEIDIRVQLA